MQRTWGVPSSLLRQTCLARKMFGKNFRTKNLFFLGGWGYIWGKGGGAGGKYIITQNLKSELNCKAKNNFNKHIMSVIICIQTRRIIICVEYILYYTTCFETTTIIINFVLRNQNNYTSIET